MAAAAMDAADQVLGVPVADEGDRHVFVGILWFLFIGLMFFAQHTTCDAYFIPAINVFTDKMKASERVWLRRWGEEAVAGATICALGCNGPELFSNLISLYTHSDAGIGVVVGSEIFNLLIIVGAAIMATSSLPLHLDVAPFARDCTFYGLSIGLLYWALLDKQVEFHEALVLLAAAVLYVGAVYFTTDLVAFASKSCSPTSPISPTEARGRARTSSDLTRHRAASFHGVEVQVEEIIHSRMTEAKHLKKKMKASDFDQEAGIDAAPEPQKPARIAKHSRRHSNGPQLGDLEQGLLRGHTLLYKDLQEVVVLSEGIMELEFRPHMMQHVTLRLKCATSAERHDLLEKIKDHSLKRLWVHKYDPTVRFAFVRFAHVMCPRLCSRFLDDEPELGRELDETGVLEKLLAIPELIINVCLMSTLSVVDVKDIRKESRWPLCFLGAMGWLAIFSFLMLETCNRINYHIPSIPISFLGITVCAVGTSFPNAVASVIMAQQEQPAAAIANALGSNVQNVFLAMALPWAIFSAQQLSFGPITQHVAGINEGVVWMVGTLTLLLLLALLPPAFALMKCHGALLILVYVAYLLVTSMETFGVIQPLM